MSDAVKYDRPPGCAMRILRRLLGPDRGRDAAWDLFDLYEMRAEATSHRRAAVRYWLDAASITIRPGLWKRGASNQQSSTVSIEMLTNHIRVAARRLRNRPGFAGLNALGLGVGLACVLFIFLYVRDELSYDRHHPASERLYRVTVEYLESGTHWAPIGPPVGPAMEDAFPKIEQMTRFFPSESPQILRKGDVQFYEADGGFADSTFFDVFGYEMTHGNPKTALVEPSSFVISEDLARKYFGRVDVLGETLENVGFQDVTVTGVFTGRDENTHLDVDYLYPMSKFYQGSEDWLASARTWAGFMTYVRLRDDANVQTMEERLPQFVDTFYEGITEGPASEAGRIHLQPVEDIHLHSHLEKEYRANSDIAYVYTFSIVALFVLLIAIVNFVNLSTARATARMREVAVRKTFGARRTQVVQQLMAESFVQSGLGLVSAVLLFVAAVPVFNNLTGQNVTWQILTEPVVAGALVGITFLVALLAGVYPALMISSFRPVDGLRGERAGGLGKTFLRKGLVVFQFAASIALIASASVIWQQLNYVQNAQLGFDKDNVMYVRLTDEMGEAMRENPSTFRDALLEDPEIVSVSKASDIPGERYSMEGMHLKGTPPDDTPMMRVAWVQDYDYTEALGLEIVAGRGFSRQAPQDTSAWIVNESAVRRLELEPESAIGRIMTWNEYSGPIVGVVRDFNIASMHREVEPLVIPLRPGYGGKLIVRFSSDEPEQVVSHVRSTFDRLVPGQLFEYTFLGEKIDALYRQESKMQAIITWFSAIAVLVACLGLFGLAAYAVTRRTTEIGVRKVLGASISQIMALVSSEFMILVGIAFAVAAPLTYLAMRRWLETFAYRIDLSPWPFLAAGVLAVIFAIVTVGGHALRAASLNPVNAISRE